MEPESELQQPGRRRHRHSRGQNWSHEETVELIAGRILHGRPVWNVILEDPRLVFSPSRTATSLLHRWKGLNRRSGGRIPIHQYQQQAEQRANAIRSRPNNVVT
jgi:hypothetical protein